MRQAEMITKILLCFLLISISHFPAFGQTDKKAIIDLAIDHFCGCVKKAKVKNVFDLCREHLDSLSVLQFSRTDSAYFLEEIGNRCGDEITKGEGRRKRDQIKCAYLTETDLAIFNLSKTRETFNAIEWSGGDAKNQLIKDLTDSREFYVSDSIAIIKFAEQKQLTLLEGSTPVKISNVNFQSLEVFTFELFDNYHGYLIYARRDHITCFLTVGMAKTDTATINALIAQLGERIKKCK